MQEARPVSDPTFLISPLDRPRGPASNRATEGRWKQRLFVASPHQPDGVDDGNLAVTSSPPATTPRSPVFPIRHRVVLPKMRINTMTDRPRTMMGLGEQSILRLEISAEMVHFYHKTTIFTRTNTFVSVISFRRILPERYIPHRRKHHRK